MTYTAVPTHEALEDLIRLEDFLVQAALQDGDFAPSARKAISRISRCVPSRRHQRSRGQSTPEAEQTRANWRQEPQVGFENLIINLLKVDNAHEIVHPGRVAAADAGSRLQLSIWVPDVDAVCRKLQQRGVDLLAGPVDKPWGMRCASFVDPAGHSWEVAEKIRPA